MADPVSDTVLANGRRQLTYELAHGAVTAVDQVSIGGREIASGRDGAEFRLAKAPNRDVTLLTVEVPEALVGGAARLTKATFRTAPERVLQAAVAAGAPIRPASYRRG